jgi:hypothetical protein
MKNDYLSSSCQGSWHYQFPLAVVITVLILSGPFDCQGQHTAALKAHIFWTINGLYTISYEQAFNKRLSAELSLQGGHYIDVRPNRFEDYEVRGIGAVGSLRYYPFTKHVYAPRGFFGYAAFRYVDFTEAFLYTASGDEYKVGGDIINAGLGIGYKYAYRRVGLEAFIGWGAGRVKSQDEEYRNNIPEFHRSSIEEQEHFPQLDLALCYMFSPFSKETGKQIK